MANLLEGEAAALNDGLLLINQFVNSAFTQLYVPEVIFEKKTRITLDFKEYRKVRAVMVYNSHIIENIFDEVEKIEFFCRDEKGEYTAEIEGLNYDLKANANIDETDGIAVYSRPGGAAIAEFDEISVNKIVITVDVPEEAEFVRISEIVVLGRR